MKVKKKRRQFFAIFLALCLILGLLPASALAGSESTAEAASAEAAAEDDTEEDTDADYIGDSSYYYQSVSFTDDDVSDYDADNSSDYSWSASATSDYYTMSGYYYAVTTSGTTTYYQVYYKVTTSTSTDDDGNTTTAIASVTLYYTTDGSTYTTIGTVSESTGISLYKAYIDSTLDYDALYAAVNGTLAESSSSDITDLTILRGYYYLNNGTLYYVYYLYTAPSTTNGTTTAASITLYYSSSASATSTSDYTQLETLTSGGTTTVTLYTEFELNISAYENTAQVFWDLDDSSGEYNSNDGDNNDSSYITSVTMTNTYADTAQTVTFGESTDTSAFEAGTSSDSYEWGTPTGGLTLSSVYVDSDGDAVSDAAYADEESTLSITPAEGYYVSQVIIVCAPYAGKSTESDDNDNSNNDNNDDDNGDNGTPDIPNGGDGGGGGGGTGGGYGGAAASDESEAVTADETVTDSESEAVAASEDNLVTAAENTGRLSPYQCSTYVTGQAYEGTFTLSDSTASSSGYTLTINLSNEYFAHSGALASEKTQVYFILIKVAAVPTPAYVEYDYGDIVSYISAYNTANELTSTSDGYVSSSIFTSNADGWTDTYTVSTTDDDGNTTTSDGNVYTDGNSNSYSGAITGNGGVLTDDTQYEYVYDTSGSTKTSKWEHYANSITEEAESAAEAAGYVFAGWAVTWYADASVASDSSGTATKTTSNYNYYTITFSDALYTSLRTEGTEVQIVGHVRLVAQWVKANDITQVIDYGLPVSTDVAEENEDDLALEAITSDVSSRISSETSYSTAKTTTLSTKITNVQYKITTTTTTTDDDRDETASTTTGYQTTAEGTYGDFTVDSTDSGTAVYTLNTEMTGIETVEYQVTLSYVTGSGSSATGTELCTPTGTLYIIPATSMYYEESFGVTYGDYKVSSSDTTYTNTVKSDAGGTSGSTSSNSSDSTGLIDYYWGGAYWVLATSGTGDNAATTSTVGTTLQETGIVGTTNDSTYGSDTYYLSESNLGDSDGSSMYVDTSDYAASFTYTFSGTGTAIYTRTLDDSNNQEGAYIRVIIWEGDTEGTISSSNNDTTTTAEESGTDTVKAVGTWFIDTRIVDSVSSSSTLYNIPIFSETNLDYGTYTVSVLVYKGGTPVQATYTTSSTDSSGDKLTRLQETETNDDETSTTTYWYYQTDESGEVLYYTVDNNGDSTEGTDSEETSTNETNYPVYYTSTSSDLTTATENGSTIYLTAVYVLADDTSGDDFYLDGIRIYNPLGTEDSNISSGDENSDAWDIASAAYKADNEANNVVINIAQKLAADAEEGYTGSSSFITLTDYYGDISGYDPDDTANYPDNEIYLDSAVTSTDDDGNSTSTTYSVSFYLAVNESTDTLKNYDVYLGLKTPDGTAGTVKINGTKVEINSSADCYYLLDSYLSSTPDEIKQTKEDGTTTTLYAYKVTITGDSGLIALTYIKVTGTDEFNIAYSTDEEGEDELSTGTETGTTEVASASVSTLYLLSAASVEVEDEDDTSADEDMLDDDSMGVDPDDSDSDADTNSGSGDAESEKDESSVFVPETFTASISYLKLLKYVSITVKASSDVSYITVNGGTMGTKTLFGVTYYSYSALRVSSGTTYEIIAYDSDGTASEPIILTVK